MFSGAAPKLTADVAPPRWGHDCESPTDNRVGLPELLAQGVAQGCGKHTVVAAMTASCSPASGDGIGEETDDRLAARLAPPSRRARARFRTGNARRDPCTCAVRFPVDGSDPTLLREQRDRGSSRNAPTMNM
jgi:hypothetical protein